MISSSVSIRSAARPYSRAGNLFTIGGTFWIVHYALPLLMGTTLGEASTRGVLGLVDASCLSLAILSLCLGLDGLALSLRRYAFGFASTSLAFTCVAATCSAIGWIKTVTTGTPPDMWGDSGVIGTCLSTTFAALAARKNGDIPKSLTKGLFVVGFLTFPLIIASICPGQLIPGHFTDELPFALSGMAFFVIGKSMQKL